MPLLLPFVQLSSFPLRPFSGLVLFLMFASFVWRGHLLLFSTPVFVWQPFRSSCVIRALSHFIIPFVMLDFFVLTLFGWFRGVFVPGTLTYTLPKTLINFRLVWFSASQSVTTSLGSLG